MQPTAILLADITSNSYWQLCSYHPTIPNLLRGLHPLTKYVFMSGWVSHTFQAPAVLKNACSDTLGWQKRSSQQILPYTAEPQAVQAHKSQPEALKLQTRKASEQASRPASLAWTRCSIACGRTSTSRLAQCRQQHVEKPSSSQNHKSRSIIVLFFHVDCSIPPGLHVRCCYILALRRALYTLFLRGTILLSLAIPLPPSRPPSLSPAISLPPSFSLSLSLSPSPCLCTH